jgi:hypothetical protein
MAADADADGQPPAVSEIRPIGLPGHQVMRVGDAFARAILMYTFMVIVILCVAVVSSWFAQQMAPVSALGVFSFQIRSYRHWPLAMVAAILAFAVVTGGVLLALWDLPVLGRDLVSRGIGAVAGLVAFALVTNIRERPRKSDATRSSHS